MWALSVQTGQPVLKSSISGASFPPNVVVILDPMDGNRNSLSNFVVETADAMRVELYRVFQACFAIFQIAHSSPHIFNRLLVTPLAYYLLVANPPMTVVPLLLSRPCLLALRLRLMLARPMQQRLQLPRHLRSLLLPQGLARHQSWRLISFRPMFSLSCR